MEKISTMIIVSATKKVFHLILMWFLSYFIILMYFILWFFISLFYIRKVFWEIIQKFP